MTYENRMPANYAFGTLTGAAAISDTTLTSTDFAARLASGLSTTTYVPMTLQDPTSGLYEIVWVNAHTASATTATVLRGREGTSARAWGSGTLWTVTPTLRDGVLPVANRAALPADPHVGLRAFLLDEQTVLERTLTGWQAAAPGTIGGVGITGTNNLGTAVGASEAMPLSMNSGTLSLLPMSRYEIKCTYKAQGSANSEEFLLRVREGASAGVAGNQLRQYLHNTRSAALGYTDEFTAVYETGASAVSKVFSMTAIRITGTGTLQFQGGDATSTNLVGVEARLVGAAGKLTSIAS